MLHIGQCGLMRMWVVFERNRGNAELAEGRGAELNEQVEAIAGPASAGCLNMELFLLLP